MHVARLIRLVTLCMATLTWGCGDGDATSSRRSVTGQVVDAQSGRGIPAATVELVSDTLDKAEAVTDGDGRFSMNLDLRDGVDFASISARHPDYQSAASRSVYFDGTENVLEIELRRETTE
jgi:hypothetical protein